MHMTARVAAVCVLALSALAGPPPAMAQVQPEAPDRAFLERTRTGATVGARAGTNEPSSGRPAITSVSNGRGGSSEPPTCYVTRAGDKYWEFCLITGGGGEYKANIWAGPPDPAAPGGPRVIIDPAALAQQAENELVLAEPEVRLNPAEDQIAQLASWLWLEGGWAEQSASASAGPVTSTVTATPQRVRWSMGNGDEVVCGGPGTPYEPRFAATPEATDCSYTYRHSSAGQPGDAYPVTVTVEYDLTWAAVGAPGGGDLGVAEQSATLPVRVSELQALVQ